MRRKSADSWCWATILELCQIMPANGDPYTDFYVLIILNIIRYLFDKSYRYMNKLYMASVKSLSVNS